MAERSTWGHFKLMKITIDLSDKAAKGFQYQADNSGRTIEQTVLDTLEARGLELLAQIPLTPKQVAAIEAIKLADDSAADAAKAAVEAR